MHVNWMRMGHACQRKHGAAVHLGMQMMCLHSDGKWPCYLEIMLICQNTKCSNCPSVAKSVCDKLLMAELTTAYYSLKGSSHLGVLHHLEAKLIMQPTLAMMGSKTKRYDSSSMPSCKGTFTE